MGAGKEEERGNERKREREGEKEGRERVEVERCMAVAHPGSVLGGLPGQGLERAARGTHACRDLPRIFLVAVF